jgi:hypothetical protein
MKKNYYCFQLIFSAGKGMLLVFICMICFTLESRGQSMTLSISATNNAVNNCNARTISVSVAGGSGSYSYFWSSEPSSSVNLGNSSSIVVSPSVATTYTVAVQDNGSNQYAQKSILINPLITGSLSLYIPTAFLEGDLWRVLDTNKSTGPLNAYRFELSIIDDWGNQVYASSRTVSSGTSGLLGGEIYWNGRLNGTGNYVPAGNYFYDLRLVNCSTNQLIRKTITFFRPSSLVVDVYPNPAQNFVELNIIQVQNKPAHPSEQNLSLPENVQLVSSRGDILMSNVVVAFPARINVSELPEDTYSLQVLFSDFILKKRLIIQR